MKIIIGIVVRISRKCTVSIKCKWQVEGAKRPSNGEDVGEGDMY